MLFHVQVAKCYEHLVHLLSLTHALGKLGSSAAAELPPLRSLYRSLTTQECDRSVQRFHRVHYYVTATPLLHYCYTTAATLPLSHCYFTTTSPQCCGTKPTKCYIIATPVLHQCYISATSLLHQCYISETLETQMSKLLRSQYLWYLDTFELYTLTVKYKYKFNREIHSIVARLVLHWSKPDRLALYEDKTPNFILQIPKQDISSSSSHELKPKKWQMIQKLSLTCEEDFLSRRRNEKIPPFFFTFSFALTGFFELLEMLVVDPDRFSIFPIRLMSTIEVWKLGTETCRVADESSLVLQ